MTGPGTAYNIGQQTINDRNHQEPGHKYGRSGRTDYYLGTEQQDHRSIEQGSVGSLAHKRQCQHIINFG